MLLYDDGIAFSFVLFFLRDLTFCVSSTIVSILSVLLVLYHIPYPHLILNKLFTCFSG